MPIKNQRRGGNASQQHTAVVWGGSLLALLLIVVGVAYYSSPYFATDSAAARMVDKTLPTTISDAELKAISSNLYTALDQVVPGGQSDPPVSILAQVGRAVTREVRDQLLLQASRRLASREGIDLALYGWQHISDHRVSIQRHYLKFPDVFAVVLVDSTDGTPLTELVFLRTGFANWTMAAVRPNWLHNQSIVLLRKIVESGIQKIAQPE